MTNPWLMVVGVLIAHFGTRLTLYNRLNGLGLPRRFVKRTERILLHETILTPVLIFVVQRQALMDFVNGSSTWRQLPVGLLGYACLCLGIGVTFGILWLIWRPIFGVQTVDASRQLTVLDVARMSDVPLSRTTRCRWMARVPLNQMLELSVERIELPVVGLPEELDGYRIAHLSDIHLTGYFEPDYAIEVVRQAMLWKPDLFALTGDIVDKPIGLEWIARIFSPAKAPDGCYFVLGNHDTRISNPNDVRDAMKRTGWIDVGGLFRQLHLRDCRIAMIGNEHPWFLRPDDATMQTTMAADFRICLSHSPDQFDWCRRHGVELMLAGHTHGGQGRLPIIGPLLSPSLHGSRWASGDFYRRPTTLHVSRGLGGTHLLRIHCRPELSLLTLRRRIVT